MSTIQDFTGYQPTWCPGCGDWGIGMAIKKALVDLGYSPSDVAIVFGIGCSGNMNDFVNAYALHSLHGRALPNAIGIKLANHKLPVIAVVGDGDCYGEGGNHLIHAARGNHDITVIVHDNRVYGLTTGQSAPTSPKGFKSKSTPLGLIEAPINPLALALTQGASFIAQTFAGDLNHMISMIKLALNHKGFSLVNILQPCVTFNKVNTYQYYLKRVYKLDDNYDKTDFKLALEKTLELNEEKFPLGVIYQIEKKSYHEQLPQLSDDLTLISKKRFEKINDLIKNFQ
ncbi:MAG: 2-oxoglutarate ferredoxin oxidoreductase subunit beta [Patescibacteria group bacterium]|nr:MAG: 2-oxoglutarate ferredoxin oxidoreductase subunit beta [Patescibacteria group bacterium]